jgi:hypothetical protein
MTRLICRAALALAALTTASLAQEPAETPEARLEPPDARFIGCWHIGQLRRAIRPRCRKRPERPGCNVRQDYPSGHKSGVDGSANQILEGGRSPAIGDMTSLKSRRQP